MPKEQEKEVKKDKPQGEKPAKKTYPLTEQEKAAKAKVQKIEKQIDDIEEKIKAIMHKLHEKEFTRGKLRSKIMESRNAVIKIGEQISEKRNAQKEAFTKAQQYIDSLHKRKYRRAEQRAELQKLLPRGAQLPPIRETEEGAEAGVSDYDRAIKIVMQEIEFVQQRHRTSSFTAAEERKMMGTEARWRSVIEQIKQLEENAAQPLADLAEVDVLGCLETCRKLSDEISKLRESSLPHYKEIADSLKKLEENRAGVPELIQERNTLINEAKELVAKLHDAAFESDKARYEAVQTRNAKRVEDAAKESAEIKARIEEFKKNREARIERAMNSLPHEREVEAAKVLLSYLRSIALPGTCGVTEAEAPKPKAPREKKPTLTSAPSVEVEEASFGATEILVSRKSQPVPKVGKKQNKKKKAAEPKPAEPKKKTLEDHVRVSPSHLREFEVVSVSVPDTFGEVEACYNEVKEKLEAYEKVRTALREEREKALKEAEKKALEDAAKKEEQPKEEEQPKAEEEPKEEKPKEEEEPKAEEAGAAVPAEEPAPESQ